ncbi:hypothetical protein J3E64_004136 [Sphingobium sp. OAS761]|uniref:hypothetical protein n=1 Tax=Sphingobium sp. OAS761 TaxID=2817901 RepID=UPI00209EEB89|nr:hypothetical protein [Sphingobium sp. OAS761]MCP1472418.1 hypothetical protein [Sphingobium sp. OAS761]
MGMLAARYTRGHQPNRKRQQHDRVGRPCRRAASHSGNCDAVLDKTLVPVPDDPRFHPTALMEFSNVAVRSTVQRGGRTNNFSAVSDCSMNSIATCRPGAGQPEMCRHYMPAIGDDMARQRFRFSRFVTGIELAGTPSGSKLVVTFD